MKCESRCKDIGTAARKLAAERNHVRSQGGKARTELVRKAKIMRKEIEDNIATTNTKIEGAEKQVQQLEEELRRTEIRERSKVEHSLGSRVSALAQLAKEKIAEYRIAIVRLRDERDDAERKVEEAEGILRTFREEYNPNFNDEGVKRAVRAWEEYLAANEARQKNRASDDDIDRLISGEEVDWNEAVGGEELIGGTRKHLQCVESPT